MTLEKASLSIGLTIDDMILVTYLPYSDGYKLPARCSSKHLNTQSNTLVDYFYDQLLDK